MHIFCEKSQANYYIASKESAWTLTAGTGSKVTYTHKDIAPRLFKEKPTLLSRVFGAVSVEMETGIYKYSDYNQGGATDSTIQYLARQVQDGTWTVLEKKRDTHYCRSDEETYFTKVEEGLSRDEANQRLQKLAQPFIDAAKNDVAITPEAKAAKQKRSL